MIGECEDVIYEAIVDLKDTKVARWYLKTLTDKYSEKQQIEHSGEISFDIKIEDLDADDKD